MVWNLGQGYSEEQIPELAQDLGCMGRGEGRWNWSEQHREKEGVIERVRRKDDRKSSASD